MNTAGDHVRYAPFRAGIATMLHHLCFVKGIADGDENLPRLNRFNFAGG